MSLSRCELILCWLAGWLVLMVVVWKFHRIGNDRFMALLYIVGLFCFRDGGGGCLSRFSSLVDVTNTSNIYTLLGDPRLRCMRP